ncbi:MAG: hypothetical protein H8E74_07630 [Gammaproteobacteria bacterium]|nr:hypothetical protein [Gammaproteobacteria bacterium]
MKFDKIILSEQFHEWYHEGLTKEDVAEKASQMYEEYSQWKDKRQQAFADSFKKLGDTNES